MGAPSLVLLLLLPVSGLLKRDLQAIEVLSGMLHGHPVRFPNRCDPKFLLGDRHRREFPPADQQ
jgi:hypothetical protein